MKLRTGEPFWLKHKAAPLRTARLPPKVMCDVAVIGAGITGALVAHQLLQAGLTVVMIDKRRAGCGSTAASTGLLLYQPDSSIADLTKLHSRRTARRVYELGRTAIQELRQLISRLEIDCGWTARPSLYLASDPSAVAELKAEGRRTRQLGFDVDELSASRLIDRYQICFPAALASHGTAQVHPFQLTRGILHHAQRNPRFRLVQNMRVSSLRERPDGPIQLRTQSGQCVEASHVVVAAGYESRQFVQHRLVRFRSTYVITSAPLPPHRLRAFRCLMWETARPYFYLRTTTDHRIVFGGADEPFDQVSRRRRKLQRKTRELEQLFTSLFPQFAFQAEYAWSGTFAETVDGLPCIGPAKAGSRIFYALGYGGNGITFSQIAARLLRDACLGQPNPDTNLFSLDRLPRLRASNRRPKAPTATPRP